MLSNADGEASAKVGPEPDFLETHTFFPMLGTAVLGVAFVLGIVWCFRHWCGPILGKTTVGVCFAIQQNPPWLPLASLASAPSLVLTWYWRTAHRKRDLRLRKDDVDMRAAELRQAQSTADYERQARTHAEVWSAIETLSSFGPKLDSALSTVRRAASDPMLAAEAIHAVSRRLRSWDDDDDPRDHDRPEDPEVRRLRQRALETICSLKAFAPAALVDLNGACLYFLTLRGLDLRGFDLTGANLGGAKLQGALLKGAILDRVRADSAEVEDNEEPTEEQMMLLMHGAHKVAKARSSESGEPS